MAMKLHVLSKGGQIPAMRMFERKMARILGIYGSKKEEVTGRFS
jgi:hypothetical protein